MIYEWYSGSDRSMRVPKQLSRVKDFACELTTDEQIAALHDLLQIERDPNWRGCIHALVGDWHEDANRERDALAA